MSLKIKPTSNRRKSHVGNQRKQPLRENRGWTELLNQPLKIKRGGKPSR